MVGQAAPSSAAVTGSRMVSDTLSAERRVYGKPVGGEGGVEAAAAAVAEGAGGAEE